jgi:Protein of unknown function (DUF1566)
MTHHLVLFSLVAAAALPVPSAAQDPQKLFGRVLGSANPLTAQKPPEAGATPSTDGLGRASSSTSAGNANLPHPRYSFSQDGSEVVDSHTGLTWRRCIEGTTWAGEACTGNAVVFRGLSRVLAHAKTAPGWRAPSIDELKSLTEVISRDEDRRYGPGGSDAYAFPGTPRDMLWSSTLYYKDRGDRDRTKTINFATGYEAFLDNGEQGYLRLVRASAVRSTAASGAGGVPVVARADSPPVAMQGGVRFAPSPDGREIVDANTGLIWRRCAEGMSFQGGTCVGKALVFDFTSAEARAKSQATTTRLQWRLPDKEELRGIGDEKKFKMAIDTSAFPATPPDHFWTSHRIDSNYAYAVNFYNGFAYDRYHTNQHYVRLVRDAR